MRFLDKYTAQEKLLRRLEREATRLRHAQWHAPVVPLEQPYQRGWVKSYVLREDVLRRPDMAVFRAVLSHVNQCVYSRERSFARPNGQLIVLRPRIIRVAEWAKLAWPASHQRLFSYGHWRLDEEVWTPLRLRKHILGFKLTGTWWLKEDVQPFLITHQRVDLPEARERLAEIESFMTTRNGWDRLNRLHGNRTRWRDGNLPPRDQRAAAAWSEQLDTEHT